MALGSRTARSASSSPPSGHEAKLPHPSENTAQDQSLFALPILDRFLVYAPLHSLAALVDRAALLRLRGDGSVSGAGAAEGPLAGIISALAAPGEPAPLPLQGDFAPAFLGLLPTRACNLACRYCGFQAAGEPLGSMDLALARDAVEWYMGLVARSGTAHAEVHFFGGEPFCAEEVLDLAVPLARRLAREAGCSLRFEVATNGTFGEARAHWAADNLDTIVLSLDGPAEVHDRQRPRRDGSGSLATVLRNARIFSEGAAELSVRACVTAETVGHMPRIAAWFCDEMRPAAVSFEPLQASPESAAAGLEPPDPWAFARGFVEAARILEAQGVEPVYAAADIRTRRVTFCPVGRDVAIVSPDGTLAACYLLPRDWQAQGLDLRLGRLEDGGAWLDPGQVAFARSLNVWNKPHCRRCFCRWHCAGGCHVNHGPWGPAGAYDRLCIQTRAIALRNLLEALGQDELASAWLGDREALEATVLQPSDLLWDVGEQL